MFDCPNPVAESDEYVCRACRMRWDRSEDRPACPKSFPTKTTKRSPDRIKLEKVAKGYHDIMALQSQQRKTMALMIRTCVIRLRSTDPAKRREATKALSDLANMLDPRS